MDSNLLVGVRAHQLNAGHRLLAQLVHDKFEVRAAFWVEADESRNVYLYIATPQVDQEGLIEPYTRLRTSLSQLQGIPLSLTDVNLIGITNPMAKDILDILAYDSDRSGVNIGPRRLADQMIAWAYIYPDGYYHEQPAKPTISENLFRQLFDLLSRGPGSHPASKVTLRDGSSFVGIPTSLSLDDDQSSVVKFVVDSPLAPRVVSTLDIVSVQ